ncbi:MAG: prepilin-type N-terminal cleavage/methylation domain-containing protein [Fibrobacteria bacterium]
MRKPGTRASLPAGAEGEAGFSLIEVMVAATVVAILATAAFYFLSSQNSMGQKGNDLMRGVNLGKLKLDSLKVTSYTNLTAGSDTVNGMYIRSWHVSVVRDGAGIPNGRKMIDINVMWPLNAAKSVTLATLKSDDLYKEAIP